MTPGRFHRARVLPLLKALRGGGEPRRVEPDDALETGLGRVVFKLLRRDAIEAAARRRRAARR